jgi:hypothetical protein
MRVKHFQTSKMPEPKRTQLEVELRMVNRTRKSNPISVVPLQFTNKPVCRSCGEEGHQWQRCPHNM